jgi:hypothetical protein
VGNGDRTPANCAVHHVYRIVSLAWPGIAEEEEEEYRYKNERQTRIVHRMGK